MTAVDQDFLDFVAEGLRLFGPSTRPAIYFESRGREHRGQLAFPADPNWKPPRITVDQLRRRRDKQGSSKNGKGKGEGRATGAKGEADRGKAAPGEKAADRSVHRR